MTAYSHIETLKQIAYAKACAVVEFGVLKLKSGQESDRKLSFFKQLSGIVKELELRHVPASTTRLKEKILAVFNGNIAITESVKVINIGNTNAGLYQDSQVQSWIMQLRGMDINYSDAYIIRKTKDMCKMIGKKIPSTRWIGGVMENHEARFITAQMRYGAGHRRAWLHTSYIPIADALYSGDCWQIDGTRVNFISHKKDDGTQGFIYIIVVRDVHSGDILGYSLDYKEDRWSVMQAVKMAVEYSGHLPYEAVFDRFPGHQTEEAQNMFVHMERLGVKVTMAHKATGKAGVERGFGTLQSVFMQESPYYYGEGIKSTRMAAHRSAEYLKRVIKKAKKEGWDFQEAFKETERVVENYRNTPLSYYSRKYASVDNSPAELHDMSETPNVQTVTESTVSLLFGFKKKKQLTHSGVIDTEIHKTKFYYKIEDFEIIKNNQSVIISYDLDDLSKVHLFKKEDAGFMTHLGTAISMDEIQIYGPTAEWNRLGKEKKRLKELEDKRKEAYQEAISHADADETALMMGQLTNKEDAEEAESIKLLEDTKNYQLKKASGGYDEIPTDADEIDFNARSQY